MKGSFTYSLFQKEPVGTFADGHVFVIAPDVSGAEQDRALATGAATLHRTKDLLGLRRCTRCLDCRLGHRSCATGPWSAIPSYPRLLLNGCGSMRSGGSWA